MRVLRAVSNTAAVMLMLAGTAAAQTAPAAPTSQAPPPETLPTVEVIGTSRFGREQQENEIDRLAVQRFKVDGPFQAGKQAKQLVELRELAMGDGNAVADAGRAELLPLQQRLENHPLALAGQFRGAGGQFLDHLLLAGDLQCRNDRVRRHKVGERHELPVQRSGSVC